LLDVLHGHDDPYLLRLLVGRGATLLYTLATLEGQFSRPFLRLGSPKNLYF
jgi:hypothetical protein